MAAHDDPNGQRQTDDAHMMRIRIPQGLLTAEQLSALADVSEKHSRGFGHIEHGRRGFCVLIGGGTTTMAVGGRAFFDFLPVEDMLTVGEAVVNGDRVMLGL